MATSAAPTGAEPIGTMGSSGSFTGKIRHIKIASAYNTAVFYGDFVKLVSSGTVELDAGTATATPVGIFMGCAYTDPNTNQLTFSQYWPASTVAADAVAYVLDDPRVLFTMQADATLAQTTLGNNGAIIQTAGSTSIGRSKNAFNATSAATTNTLPLRIIDFVNGPTSAVGDAFTDIVCAFVPGMHLYETATGV